MPLWLVAIILVLLFMAALESGFWLGLRKYRINKNAEKTVRGDVTLGSMLALLGLILAFTYAFSLSRADHRKDAIVNEVNAINTAFLRADLAAEPGRSELRNRLLDYARTRLVTAEMVSTQDALQDTIARSLEAQSYLWYATKEVMQGDVPWPLKSSIMLAINAVFDAHNKRIAAVNDRLPDAILMLLTFVALVSVAGAGYQAGLTVSMNHWRRGSFVLIVAALLLIIIDFDRSFEGLIEVNQETMVALIQNLESAASK
ncbi:MAG: hypothetical protein ACI9MF_002266 [Gammaproteobacteria bacterium]|jgi:hypothetical protein